MKVLGIASIGLLLLFSQTADAASWAIFSVSVKPQDADKLAAAADKLMSSKVGQEFPGKLLLQAYIANGTDPATHSFVPIYKSAAERETFVQKLQTDAAWKAFQASTAAISQPVSQSLYRTVKRWGDIVDTDHVWVAHAFTVTVPPEFLAALDGLMASPTGVKFPGQVYLSEVVAAGASPVTHVISVGYESEAEMESWEATRDASTDWSTYLGASRSSAQYLGATMSRDVKSWGATTLKEVSQ